jgi:hypothetical protein
LREQEVDVEIERSPIVTRLELRLRILTAINTAMALAIVAAIVASCRTTTPSRASAPPSLTVSEINVVDGSGVVRLRLSGDVPDAVHDGKRVPRGQHAAGVILYDDTGQERGGYLTFSPSRNVALTLDNRGTAGQTAILAAGPDAGSGLTLSQGNDAVDIRVDDQLGPTIHVMKSKAVAFHVPELRGFEATPVCGELRGAMKTMSRDDVLAWCRSRLPEDACLACVGPK